MQGFLRTYADGDLQCSMDAAVVIPTVLRPYLRQALESVFAQLVQQQDTQSVARQLVEIMAVHHA